MGIVMIGAVIFVVMCMAKRPSRQRAQWRVVTVRTRHGRYVQQWKRIG